MEHAPIQPLPKRRLWPVIIAACIAPASGIVVMLALAWLFGPSIGYAGGRGVGYATLMAPAVVVGGVWRWRQSAETPWTPIAAPAVPAGEVEVQFRPTPLDVLAAVGLLVPVLFFGLFSLSPVIARTAPGSDVPARTAGCVQRAEVRVRTTGQLPAPPFGDRYLVGSRLCAAARDGDGVALTAHVDRIAGYEVLAWVRSDRAVWENAGVDFRHLVLGLGGLAAAIVLAMYGLRDVYLHRRARLALDRRLSPHPGGVGIVVSRGVRREQGGELRSYGVRWLLSDGVLESREPIDPEEARIGARRVFAPGEVDGVCRHVHGRFTATTDVTAYRLIHGLFGVTLELRHRSGGTQRVGVDFACAVHPDALISVLQHRPTA